MLSQWESQLKTLLHFATIGRIVSESGGFGWVRCGRRKRTALGERGVRVIRGIRSDEASGKGVSPTYCYPAHSLARTYLRGHTRKGACKKKVALFAAPLSSLLSASSPAVAVDPKVTQGQGTSTATEKHSVSNERRVTRLLPPSSSFQKWSEEERET